MSKWIVCISLFLPLLRIGNCSDQVYNVVSYLEYSGDSCVTDEGPGSCKVLSECAPLLLEIQEASTPIPIYLRVKLQKLSCGFEFDEPIVCCVNPIQNWITSDTSNPEPDQFTSSPPVIPLDHEDNFDTSDSNRDIPGVPSISNHVGGHRNLAQLPENCGTLEANKIFGGNRTNLYEMPWMVLVAYDSPRGVVFSCGGTLINERYVLTAAHCVSFLGTRLTLKGIVLGEYDVRSDPDCERLEGELSCAPSVRQVNVSRVIAHTGYSPDKLSDDIALVRLAEPADFSLDSMKAICLPSTSELQQENLVGKKGVVAGWGATEDGLQSPVLLSVDLPIITNSDCQSAYSGTPRIHDSQMCAGGLEDKDSCGGDSGGPLLYPGRVGAGPVRYVQRGIVSFGSKRCGLGGYPGVYTRISHYMDWILDNISE